jgi:hypothetical protein
VPAASCHEAGEAQRHNVIEAAPMNEWDQPLYMLLNMNEWVSLIAKQITKLVL